MVNAFWLSDDVEQAARWLVDRHVTSSVLENAMVLTTAAQANGYPEAENLYETHADHPLTRWAGHSVANWLRLRAYTEAAHDEWRYRWDHGPDDQHASWSVIETLERERLDSLDWPADEYSDPPQVMGPWSADTTVDAYRYYYANEKRYLFSWAKDRSKPPWIDRYTVDGAEAEHQTDRSVDADTRNAGVHDDDTSREE